MLRSQQRRLYSGGRLDRIMHPSDPITGTAYAPDSTARGGVTYKSVALADSPVFLVMMDEASGTPVDSSTNGFTVTKNGSPTYHETGPGSGAGLPYAMGFNGSGDYLSLADNAAFDLTPSWSMECWFKTSTGGTSMVVMTHGYGTGGNSYDLDIRSDNGKLQSNNIGVGGAVSAGTGAAVTDGAWHHAVVTNNAGSGTLYLDGVSVSTGTLGNLTSAQAFSLGCYLNNGTPGQYFNGKLAAAALYNTALSSGRVSAHYAAK
jgi:hypothetical protein